MSTFPEALTTTPNGKTKKVQRPDIDEFMKIDPSEAVRSDEMVPLLTERFEPVVVREYGGNLFAWLFSGIMFHFDDQNELVERVLDVEMSLLEAGVLKSHHMLAFYRKK